MGANRQTKEQAMRTIQRVMEEAFSRRAFEHVPPAFDDARAKRFIDLCVAEGLLRRSAYDEQANEAMIPVEVKL